MSTVGVVIGTFGSDEWATAGAATAQHAFGSAGADKVMHVHGNDLATARNDGAERIGTDYLVFLDADDRLCKDYCNILKAKIIQDANVLYQPETHGMYKDGTFDEKSNFILDRDMNISNHLVIGTAIKSSFFLGFDSNLIALEDWDLFRRMLSNGAKILQVSGMIYYVGINNDSRNNPQNANIAYSQVIRKDINYLKDYCL